MSEQTQTIIRMRDVLLALAACDLYEQRLSKVELQKLIYLIDAVSYLYELLPPSAAHLTYKFGPYDSKIQNAVDALAFRGFVYVADIRSFEQSVSVHYALSDAGKLASRKISEGQFSMRWQAASDVAERMSILGWHRLVSLVYAEPTFLAARSKGYGQPIAQYDGIQNSAALVISTLAYSLTVGFVRGELERGLLVDLFFRYLDQYAREAAALQSLRSKPP